MADDQIRTGTITKVVHVQLDIPEQDKRQTGQEGSGGYGIIQGIDGRDVFFVDNALQDAQFAELQTGRDARYIVETGPFGRAVKVWVAD